MDRRKIEGPFPVIFNAKNGKKVIIQETDLDAPRTIYEARSEAGKQSRREARKLTGKDTTKRGVQHKQYQVQKHQKANCLVTVDSELNNVIDKNLFYRKLTLLESKRLQTIPDDYCMPVSDYQCRKLLGNGWCVEVIKHIYQNMEHDE